MLKDEFCTSEGPGCVILRGALGEWEFLRSQSENAACEIRADFVITPILYIEWARLYTEWAGVTMKRGAAPSCGAAPLWVFACGGWLSWMAANFRLSFVSFA